MPTPPGRRQRRAGGLSDALGRADIAAEFLRRNRTYRAEHAQMQQRIANGAVANLTASRVSREKVRKIRFFERNAYVERDGGIRERPAL